jgi:hypothetical protein
MTNFVTRPAVFCTLALLLASCAVNPVPTPGAKVADENGPAAASDTLATDSSVADSGTLEPTAGLDGASTADTGAWTTDTGVLTADTGALTADTGALTADAGGMDTTNCQPKTPLQVLFLGNSYTFYNDLPGLLKTLADKEGAKVATGEVLKGGQTLGAGSNAHSIDSESLTKLQASPWDVVVLQEQSQIPTIPAFMKNTMVPGANKLSKHLKQANSCAKVVLFLTWGRKAGGKQCAGTQCSADFKNFDQMQDALTAAYLEVAKQVGGAVVPVGEAWRAAIKAGAPDLFDGDGSHPSKVGSYLAALTFYAALFKKTPVDAWHPDAVSDAQANTLRKIAADTVMNDLPKWGL